MRTSPLRVALWCVVMLAVLVFISVVREANVPPPVIATPAPSRTIAPPPTPVPSPAPIETSYAGNVNSHKFHSMSCQYATCPNCTARFATRDEALAAGFRPGGCCKP